MRSLTSIQSSTIVKASLQFHLKLSDQSTTFIFGQGDINALTGINWEIPFGGGFSKPSNYQITLATSVDFIKTYRKTIINGEGSLKVFVNSDNFVPSIGRVRDMTRFPANLNLIQLQVYDKFLDSNPKIPIASIVDSYSPLHPEVSNADMGYPLYYGKHTRPFFLTAVDCNINTLVGPFGVSSENHVSSLFFNTDMTKGCNFEERHVTLFNKTWRQESTSTNRTFGGNPFEIKEPTNQANEAKILLLEGSGVLSTTVLSGNGTMQSLSGASGVYEMDAVPANKSLPDRLRKYIGQFYFNANLPQEVEHLKRVSWNYSLSGVSGLATNSFNSTSLLIFQDSGNTFDSTVVFSHGSTFVESTFQTWPVSVDGNLNFLNKKNKSGLSFVLFCGSTDNDAVLTLGVSMLATLKSEGYKNYSIFAAQQNCAEIAITENPMGIAADIINQTSFSFVAAQNSQAQYNTSSYNFQCLFDKRQDLTKILDEFGRTSAAYMWVGDSGFINFNTYQDSQTLVTSDLISATITTTDFVENSLTIRDNPLGTTVFDTQKAQRVQIDYDYDYTLDKFVQSNVANPDNNAFCNSAFNSGIQTAINVKTRYIKEAFTSSLYLANIVRKVTQDEQIVEMSLPARFFGLELSDVIKLQHPVLVGSESLFQITKISPDYLKGSVKITANEIQNL